MPASLELVKIALKAYGDGDVEIALALSDPNVRWDERASRPDGDLVWGKDDVASAMRAYLDSWQDYRFELEDIAEVAPGKVVGICRERGVSDAGVPVDRRFGGLWVVQRAKIASWATYLTPKEAVRAARELSGGAQGPERRSVARAPAPEPAPPEPAPEEPAPEEPLPQATPAEAGSPVAAVPEPERAHDPNQAERPEQPRKPAPLSEEQRRAAKARARLRRQKAAS